MASVTAAGTCPLALRDPELGTAVEALPFMVTSVFVGLGLEPVPVLQPLPALFGIKDDAKSVKGGLLLTAAIAAAAAERGEDAGGSLARRGGSPGACD